MVSYMLPSGLIAPKEKSSRMTKSDFDCLLRAARNLDTMFETLVKDICSPNAVPRANLPTISPSNRRTSSVTVEILEDSTLALDWVDTNTSRSSSIWTLPKTPDETEAEKSEETDQSASGEHMNSVLRQHALRRRSRQEEDGKAENEDEGRALVSISEECAS